MEAVYQEIKRIAGEHTPEEILVCFDIDLTLTAPENKNAAMKNIKAHRDFFRKILKPLSEEERFLTLVFSTKQGKSTLIEKKTPEIIKKLQIEGYQTMAVTRSLPGKLGNIPSLEEHRVQDHHQGMQA